ncbi:MAG: hypothetical protein OEW31_11055 [Thermoleophilia bacterium]|nr:hypothetical protein [Thermoleophilia bacterium]MDH4346861.1 hypothetical protein [Thermoleophilia bacterium]MDH5334540.1 hypothetical protein [Thermoleophilia bacterium]
MSVLAATRPDSWNFPLLLHVAGAMVLVGAAATGSICSLAGSRDADAAWLRRVAFYSFLLVALPAYLVMRIGAEWLYSKEFGETASDPTWIDVGYLTADLGALILLLTLVASGLAVRRGSRGLTRVAGVLSAVAVVGWLVAVWAMGGKPG